MEYLLSHEHLFPKEHINESRFSLTGETAEKFLKKNIDLYIEETVEFQDALLKI